MSDKKAIKLSTKPDNFGDSPDELDQTMFVSTLPIQNSHSYYEDEASGLYVGVWDTTDMVEAPAPYACEEFMVLIEGAAEIKNNKTQKVETVLAGESFIIPLAYDCQWQQKGYLRKFYLISEPITDEEMPDAPVVEGIVKIKSNMQEQASVEEQRCHYRSIDGKFMVSTWERSAGSTAFERNDNHQFYFLEKGKLTLSYSDGSMQSYKSGDAFFLVKGTSCKWHADSTIFLHFAEVA